MGRSNKDIREIHNLGTHTREWVVSSEALTSTAKKQPRHTGFTEARSGYRFERIAPPFAQVLVTESGEGVVLVNGEWRLCPPGFAYLTAPRAACAYHIKPGCRRWRLHWSIYDEESLLPTLPAGAPPRLIPVEATAFRHSVEGYCHENGSRANPSVLSLWAALVDHAVLRILGADKGDARLDQLWVTVNRDLGGAWTLRRMARASGLSEESLRRLCQKHLKRSPMAQLTRMRMQAAADLLKHSSEKLESLSSRFGYADAFSFSTAFHRVMGLPPSAYRAQRA
jgi:AraC-like DNA-binding protein